MRALTKRLAEVLLASSGLPTLSARVRRGRTLVLAYHNIIPSEASGTGDRSLHLPLAAFAAQLDSLLDTHDVVPLGAIDGGARSNRPRIVITFDDAYRGALTLGVPELVKRGLPATVFVAPALFGTTTWWDRLADPATGAVPAATRDTALTTHHGRAQEVHAALGSGTAHLPPWAEIATETEVRAAAALPGITLGSHSWTHANLAALAHEELLAELERPLDWLETAGATTQHWIAYPYGLTSPTVARAAAAAGYDGALRIDGGWIPPGPEARERRFDLPRLNVPAGISLAGFRLRTAGLL